MSTAPAHPNQSRSWARPAATLLPRLSKSDIHPRAWTPRHLFQLNIQVSETHPSKFLIKFLPPSLDTHTHIAALYKLVNRPLRNIVEGQVADIQWNVTALPFEEETCFQIVDYMAEPLGLSYKLWPKLKAHWCDLTIRWKPWMVVGRRVVMLGGDRWKTNERIVGALFTFANGQQDVEKDVVEKDVEKDPAKERFWAVVMRDKWGIVATVEGSARDFRLGKPAEEGPMVVEISRWKLESEKDGLTWVESVGRVFELACDPTLSPQVQELVTESSVHDT